MYKVIDGELYNVAKVEQRDIDTRIHNVIARVENIDNQLKVLLEEKQKVLASIGDLKEIVPLLYPNFAQKLGM